MNIRDREFDIAERRDQRKRDRKETKKKAKQQRIDRQQLWAVERRRIRSEAEEAKEARKQEACLEAKRRKQFAGREDKAVRQRETGKHLQPSSAGHGKDQPVATGSSRNNIKEGRSSQRPRVMFNLLASELEEVQTLSSSTDKNSSSNNNNKSQENRAGGLKYAPRTAQRGLDDAIRSVCNKLTPNNIPSLTEAVTDLFVTGKYPRADVLASLAENIVANAIVQDTPVTASVSLAYAGLLRGLQILHGNDVGAPVVEHLCKEVAKQQRNQETESPLKNGAMLLASLFVSHCVDCDLAVTFLHALLTPTSTESDAVAAVHFIQNAGDRLRKDAPVGLSQAVVKANEAASGASTQRKAMLLSSIKSFVSQRPKPKRGPNDSNNNVGENNEAAGDMSADDASAAVTKGICAILSKRLGEGSSNMRALQRAVTSSNMLSVKWSYIIRDDKPPRWHALRPGAGDDGEEAAPSGVKKRPRTSERTLDAGRAEEDSGDEDSDSEDEQEARSRARREEISALRSEETALAGQRFPTEAKRQIFKCLSGASDDLEALQMIVLRDPSGSQLLDTAAVILQCCQQESLFNPFYGRVLQRLTSAKKSFRQTLQFAVWDRFKLIRIDPADVTSYINLSCLLTQLLEEGIFSLSIFRGLDLDSVNKQLGLFCKVLFSRLIAGLSAKALTMTFFGTDGFIAADLNTDTNKIRRCIAQFLARYFLDEDECSKWLPHVYDVVCFGTVFGDGQDPEGFLKRVRVAHKALVNGVS